jgi:hypothetical protein
MQCKAHFPMQNPDVLFFKFICRKNNMRLEFNVTGFFGHLSVYKGGEEWLQGKWTGGGHVLQ